MHLSELDNGRANPTVREGLGTQFSVLIGLCLLGVVATCFISLASWNVLDPSFSYANGREPTNTLGYPGAVFADLTMQFLGLAAAIALVPPSIWGWTKLMQRKIPAFRQRILIWPVSMLLTAAFFACLPTPQSWPLPLGLGGLIGKFSLALPEFLVGDVHGFVAALLAVLFGATGLGATLAASGLVWRLKDTYSEGLSDDVIDSLVDNDEEPSWFLGAIGHYYYAAKMRFQSKKQVAAHAGDDPFLDVPKPGLIERFKAFHANMMKSDPDALDEFDPRPAYRPAVPEFDEPPMAADAMSAHVPFDGPAYGENTYNDFEQHAEHEAAVEEWAPQEVPPAAQVAPVATPPEPAGRVQAMAPPPKPSARVQREAQPSLISMSDFDLPSLHYLQETPPASAEMQLSQEALEQNARLLEGVLEDFGVKGEIINVRPGPVVTLYELEPAPGIKSSRVIGLADDIARSMSAIAARVAVVPGRNAIGIELPNSKRETVYLREILSSTAYDGSKAKLPLILGKTIGGEATIADLAKMPHLLVAGTTGSGKSVAINTMILSILYRMTPEQVKMIMIDPKMLELSIYDGIPHLLTPVVTDPKKAVVALKWTVREMENRYKMMSKVGVRNIDGFNSRVADATKKGERITRTIQTGYDRDTGEAIYEVEELELEPMPYIIVIIDEMADLMMVAGKDIEGTVQRLAQMARAAGIHVIMATQRPSVDVITGTIKANFPTRISFQVTSKIDSRTILGEQGAEQLLGMGDMLYMAGGGRIQRVHGPFVADDEVDKVVQHLKEQGVPQYLEAVTEETEEDAAAGGGGDAGGLAASNDIYDQAVAIVLKDRKVSTSYIQRRLSIGYNRAASLIERMEQEGLISAANHAGKREILVPGEDETI